MRTQVAMLAPIVLLVGSGFCLTNGAHGQLSQRLQDVFAERLQDMNLNDEQVNKITAIREEFKSRVEEEAQELAGLLQEEISKVSAVLTAEQEKMVKALKEERAEWRAESLVERLARVEDLELSADEMAKFAAIRKEFRPKIAKSLEVLKGTLTESQRNAREKALAAGKKPSEVIASLKLTGEQMEMLATVGREVRALIRQEMEKVSGVLDTEQQGQLTELKSDRKESFRDYMASAIENFRDLNLNDDQKNQIAEIRNEYLPKIDEAGNKLRMDVRKELAAVVAVIRD